MIPDFSAISRSTTNFASSDAFSFTVPDIPDFYRNSTVPFNSSPAGSLTLLSLTGVGIPSRIGVYRVFLLSKKNFFFSFFWHKMPKRQRCCECVSKQTKYFRPYIPTRINLDKNIFFRVLEWTLSSILYSVCLIFFFFGKKCRKKNYQ